MPVIISVIDFVFVLLGFLLEAVIWLIIANAVMSWLVLFDIVNLRNPTARSVVGGLDRITRPLLAPLRRFIPPLGGIDITPMILVFVILAAQSTLVPALHLWLLTLAGAGGPA